MDHTYTLDLQKQIQTKAIMSPGLEMSKVYNDFKAITENSNTKEETTIQTQKEFYLDDLFQNKNKLLSKYSNETSE